MTELLAPETCAEMPDIGGSLASPCAPRTGAGSGRRAIGVARQAAES